MISLEMLYLVIPWTTTFYSKIDFWFLIHSFCFFFSPHLGEIWFVSWSERWLNDWFFRLFQFLFPNRKLDTVEIDLDFYILELCLKTFDVIWCLFSSLISLVLMFCVVLYATKQLMLLMTGQNVNFANMVESWPCIW